VINAAQPDIMQRLTCTDRLLKDQKFTRQLPPGRRESLNATNANAERVSPGFTLIGDVMTDQTFRFHDDHSWR
jgi:hypothetical protein